MQNSSDPFISCTLLSRHKHIRCILLILLSIVVVHESCWWLHKKYQSNKANELYRYVMPLGGSVDSPRLRLLLTNSIKVKDNVPELLNLIRRTIPIKILYLSGSDIDDSSIKTIVDNLPDLSELYVGRTRVTDDGLKTLFKAPRLCVFHARHTDIGNEGVQYIAECKELLSVSLTGKRITDDAALLISTLPRLTSLALDDTSITDKGLSYLARMNGLEELSLEGANISDEGIKRLKDTRIKSINAKGTAVTIENVDHIEIGTGPVQGTSDPEYE